VVSELCAQLAEQSAKAKALQTAYCPAPKPVKAEPALTPEELQRKQAFERILEASRRGEL
jgi:hypothetical protein